MNFSFTRAKTITTVVIWILVGFIMHGFLTCMGGGFCGIYFDPMLILSFLWAIIPSILIYLIWSLVQKKH